MKTSKIDLLAVFSIAAGVPILFKIFPPTSDFDFALKCLVFTIGIVGVLLSIIMILLKCRVIGLKNLK